MAVNFRHHTFETDAASSVLMAKTKLAGVAVLTSVISKFS